MQTVFFLPGAGGSPLFWKPVADRLPNDWDKVHFGWPCLGNQPHDPAVSGIDDLVKLVEKKINGPVDLVAQSMGGVVAARIALARPEFVRRLVLVVTSAGVDMARFGASDWRPDAAEPDLTLDEIRARLKSEKRLKTGTTSVWRFYERHDITFKKNFARCRTGSS